MKARNCVWRERPRPELAVLRGTKGEHVPLRRERQAVGETRAHLHDALRTQRRNLGGLEDVDACGSGTVTRPFTYTHTHTQSTQDFGFLREREFPSSTRVPHSILNMGRKKKVFSVSRKVFVNEA